MLAGIKKNNVDFIPNYDETLKEPVTLPAAFPNLLCNPNTGIGVAMACNWAPHNLTEVANAIEDYLSNKPVRPIYPDFPTGGLVINKNDIPHIAETGHGSVKIRARYTIEKDKIIFYEIPYGETIEGLIAEVGTACEKGDITGISDIHDESSKKIRIVITCEKGSNPESIVKKLYTKTNFQTTFSYNQVALIDKTPTELNLKDAIKIYVDHNIDCIIKETTFSLEKAKARFEIVQGLLKALALIDEIINCIKKSESAAAAKENLIARYQFTENQAKAILAMRLSSLAKLEAIELNKEAQALSENIDYFIEVLSTKSMQIDILRGRLGALVEKYGDERKTELTQLEEPIEEKTKVDITPEDVMVIVSLGGEIKRIPKRVFKTQHKRGTGIKTPEKAILKTIATNTTDTLMIFTSEGKMYRLSVDKIPEGTNASKGVNLSTLLPLSTKETIQTVTNVSNDKASTYIVFFTKKGLIKKSLLSEYCSTKKTTGIQAIKIKEGDELISVSFMENEDVLMFTKTGFSIRVSTKDIRAIGRLTSGVKGITLKDNDEVVSAFPIFKDTENIAIITTKGRGKKTPLKDFIIQGRGGRGSSCMKLDIGDTIAAAATLLDNSSLLLTGTPNSICIPGSELTLQSKTASGSELIKNSTVSQVTIF